MQNISKGYITPKQMADLLGVSYSRILVLIISEDIEAKKVKCRWQIDREYCQRIVNSNQKKINDLKAEYVSLYWQGLDPDVLEKRVCDDFDARGIVHKKFGFATLAIYESLC